MSDVDRPMEVFRCPDCERAQSPGVRISAIVAHAQHRATCHPAGRAANVSEQRPPAEWRQGGSQENQKLFHCHRGLCTDRRLHDGRSGRPQRLHRLAVLATLQARTCSQLCSVRSNMDDGGSLPPTPEPRASAALTTTARWCWRTCRYRGWPCRLDRFHGNGRANSSVIRLVKGQRGKVAMQRHLTLRFDYGATVPVGDTAR